MKVKVTQEFYDLEKQTLRKKGDTFEVTEERHSEMQRYVEEIKAKKK